VRKDYGVPSRFGLLLGRVTYVIDIEDLLRHVFNSQMHPERRGREALTILKTIND